MRPEGEMSRYVPGWISLIVCWLLLVCCWWRSLSCDHFLPILRVLAWCLVPGLGHDSWPNIPPTHHFIFATLLLPACSLPPALTVRARAWNKWPSEGSQSRRRPLLGPSPGWKRLLALSHLRHYAKRALTPRSLNVKSGPRRNYHKGRAAIRHYANQTARPFWLLCRGHIERPWSQCPFSIVS